jgi:acetyl/propionyl-CoA carboxylase alpha subunit
MECRITSEDPANGFLPSTGRIEFLRIPGGPGVRWDAGVELGDEVTLFYDSLLAKLIVHGSDRPDACARLQRALRACSIEGVKTNVGLHRAIAASPEFLRGGVDTRWLPGFLAAQARETGS